MALGKPRKDYVSDELRIVLVGKTGSGKSATGNTIIGEEKFESLPSSTSVTTDCQHFALKRFDHNLQIVDAPGFHDTNNSQEEMKKRIAQCVTLLSPGITAILFVVRIGRFTEEDDDCIRKFIKTFGKESKEFVIAIFTAADDLTPNYDLDTFIQTSKVFLKRFLKEINNRYIAVNNRDTPNGKETFVKKLLDKIEQLQRDNGRTYYTCTMLKDAETHLKKVEAEKLKEIEKRNQEKDEKIIKEATAPYQAKLAEVEAEKEKQQALFAEKLAALDEDEKMRKEVLAKYEAKLAEVKKNEEKQAAFYAKTLAVLKEDDKKKEEVVVAHTAKLAEMKDNEKKQAALFAKTLAALKEDEKKRAEAAAQNEALLHKFKVEKEKQEAFYKEKLENMRDEFNERNKSEAREETRDEVSLAVRSLTVGGGAAAGAGAGALVGLPLGPIGSAAGALIGGAVGAASTIIGNIVHFFKR